MNVILSLNSRLQPIHRFDIEDALDELLHKSDAGEVLGGGTYQDKSGEITGCEIEISLKREDSVAWLVDIVNAMGIPKGSYINRNGKTVAVGTLEGMAIYLNGTDLPKSVYESCDINYLVENANRLLDSLGSLYSWWENPSETALYFYGKSYDEMLSVLKPFIEEYPLFEKCRISKIA